MFVKNFLGWLLNLAFLDNESGETDTRNSLQVGEPPVLSTTDQFSNYEAGKPTGANYEINGDPVNQAFSKLVDAVFKWGGTDYSGSSEVAYYSKGKKSAKLARHNIEQAATIMLAVSLASGLMEIHPNDIQNLQDSFATQHHENIATSLSQYFSQKTLNTLARKYYSALKVSKSPIEAINSALEVKRDRPNEPLGCSFLDDQFSYNAQSMQSRYVARAPPPLRLNTIAEVEKFMRTVTYVSKEVLKNSRFNDVDQLIRLVDGVIVWAKWCLWSDSTSHLVVSFTKSIVFIKIISIS